eukprot:IDg7070t1
MDTCGKQEKGPQTDSWCLQKGLRPTTGLPYYLLRCSNCFCSTVPSALATDIASRFTTSTLRVGSEPTEPRATSSQSVCCAKRVLSPSLFNSQWHPVPVGM